MKIYLVRFINLLNKIFFVFVKDFISQSPTDANGQLDKFYNFASMQMFA